MVQLSRCIADFVIGTEMSQNVLAPSISINKPQGSIIICRVNSSASIDTTAGKGFDKTII